MSREAPAYPQGKTLLAGKTVVVTAAAGTGIGFWTARRCAEEGATVLISDLHERRLGESADELEKVVGTRPATCLCDVTKADQVEALAQRALERFGAVHVVHNNAGVVVAGPVAEARSVAEAVVGSGVGSGVGSSGFCMGEGSGGRLSHQ